MNQLYFLHIPKTAGQSIRHMIKTELDKHGLPSYISNQYPHFVDLNNVVFLSSHMGTYPIEKNKNFDVCTLIRNPLEARSSYFNFIYEKYIQNREEYKKIKKYQDKFRYYLFEDKNFLIHNNYQSRFICNPMDSRAFDVQGFYDYHHEELMSKYKNGFAFDWFVPDAKTSMSNAISMINSFRFINTLNDIDLFMSSVSEWFELNYSISIPYDKSLIINKSYTLYDGKKYTSQDLIEELSSNEKLHVLELNNIDNEIYKYVSGGKYEI